MLVPPQQQKTSKVFWKVHAHLFQQHTLSCQNTVASRDDAICHALRNQIRPDTRALQMCGTLSQRLRARLRQEGGSYVFILPSANRPQRCQPDQNTVNLGGNQRPHAHAPQIADTHRRGQSHLQSNFLESLGRAVHCLASHLGLDKKSDSSGIYSQRGQCFLFPGKGRGNAIACFSDILKTVNLFVILIMSLHLPAQYAP